MALNATPSEIERLMIFTAAEFARRNRALGIRLSHPEAVALITDEVMTAARRDLPYDEIRDLAGRLLTTDDVLPGVSAMVPLIVVEGGSPRDISSWRSSIQSDQETKLRPRKSRREKSYTPDEDIDVFAGAPAVTVEVINTGDRDVQVRSHTHFFEANRSSRFDRAAAWGMKLDVPAGAGVRFEPGIPKVVRLVPIAGDRAVLSGRPA